MKSEQTKKYILEKVSPVFNSRGYFGTSLSEITEVTGLTKGAIYGNFANKEDLAVAAFNYNIRSIIGKITIITNEIDSPLAKLLAISNFYRNYYERYMVNGGCPVLNVGIDANNNNQKLFIRVREVLVKLQLALTNIIEQGKQSEEFVGTIDSKKYGALMFSLIEGAVFTSTIMKDPNYLKDMMNHLDKIILNELKK
ncbi:MAG: TetR/AcrR family transcriptional repressor of nem operon [Patiriisocius sp.]|jgi:TetR/AcrR family transcriptional repressor of nem operon